MSISTWVFTIVVILWVFAAIGMDPTDYRGAAHKFVRTQRAVLVVVFLIVLIAYGTNYLLPPVADGIDPKLPF